MSLAIRLTPHELEAYDELACRTLHEAMQIGDGALLYLQHYVRDALRNTYDLPNAFGDEACRCVNVSYTGVSDVLHGALEAGGARVALAWHLRADGRLQCSMRSTREVDCSAFAEQYGGGGHAQASGFSLASDAPFAKRLLAGATGA